MRRIDFFAEVANERQTSIQEIMRRDKIRRDLERHIAQVMRDWGLVNPVMFDYAGKTYRMTLDGSLEESFRASDGSVTWDTMGFVDYSEVGNWLLEEMPDEEIM